MPTTKVLIDTNILVYAYDGNSVFHAKAVAFLSDPAFDFYISTKNVSEFFAVLSKQLAPFDLVFKFYQAILANATMLYPNKSSLTIFETLLHKYQPKGNRVFDLEIVSIALANSISEIATANGKDFFGVSEVSVLEV